MGRTVYLPTNLSTIKINHSSIGRYTVHSSHGTYGYYKVHYDSTIMDWKPSGNCKPYGNPRKSKDQTLPIGSRESFTWIILKTILCLVLDFQGNLMELQTPMKLPTENLIEWTSHWKHPIVIGTFTMTVSEFSMELVYYWKIQIAIHEWRLDYLFRHLTNWIYWSSKLMKFIYLHEHLPQTTTSLVVKKATGSIWESGDGDPYIHVLSHSFNRLQKECCILRQISTWAMKKQTEVI